MTERVSDFIPLAHRLADAARPVIRHYFRTPIPIDHKADKSPVTVADREVETTMRAILKEIVPHHGILGEEHGQENPNADWIWVLDPIDGTKSFITGHPCFTTLIGLTYRGIPVLGLIDQAITDERWFGAEEHPATLNGQVVKTRPCKELSQAYSYSTGPEYFCSETQPAWEKISNQVKSVRYGCDSYAYGLLAAGYIDLVVEAGLQPYDFCALVPVVQSAGGTITDWKGKPVTISSNGRICAAGDASLHQQALSSLNT